VCRKQAISPTKASARRRQKPRYGAGTGVASGGATGGKYLYRQLQTAVSAARRSSGVGPAGGGWRAIKQALVVPGLKNLDKRQAEAEGARPSSKPGSTGASRAARCTSA
jgi:hypothetical protein